MSKFITSIASFASFASLASLVAAAVASFGIASGVAQSMQGLSSRAEVRVAERMEIVAKRPASLASAATQQVAERGVGVTVAAAY